MNKLMNSLFLAGLVALTPSVLLAHTDLATSSPANEAVLNKAPEKLELTFTEEVQLLKVAVTNSEGAQELASFKPTATAQKTFAVPLSTLKQGVHTVNITYMGDDGHRVDKKVIFTVDATAHEAAGATHESADAPHATHPAGH